MTKSAALKNAASKATSVTDLKTKRDMAERLRLGETQESRAHPGLARFASSEDSLSELQIGFAPYIPGMVVQVGMHLSVPLHLLSENEHNSRALYSESDIEELRQSIDVDGQLQPALVYPPKGPGLPFMIQEGQTRLYALQRNKAATMDVQVVPPPADWLQAFRQSRTVNQKRKNLTVFDDAIRFKTVMEKYPELQVKELAEVLEVSASYMVKTQKIGELPREFLIRMQDSKELFGVAMAYGVALYSKNSTLADTEALLDKICAGEISSKRLQEITSEKSAQAKIEEGAGKPRHVRHSEIKGGGKGELKLSAKGRLEIKLVLADRSRETELYEKMREVLSAHGLSFSDEVHHAD